LPRLLSAVLVTLFLAIAIRTAWIADDAEITFRTVLNVTHGFGLTYNIAERVQTFTHPLWLLLLTLTYVATDNIYAAALILSIAVSLGVFWLVLRRAATPAQAALGALVLIFSRAFVDFSVSGLENPLLHLLLAIFVGVAVAGREAERPRLAILWTLAALLYLTRPDAVLLVLPALLVETARIRQWRTALSAAALGLTPALAWTLFSLLYYGFPFPNTAYAKLATGISRGELWTQGGLYLIDSLDRDPLTLLAASVAIALGAATTGLARGLAAGIALYLVYVASVGGDFMAGRFLTAPLLLAVLVLTRFVAAPMPAWYAGAALFAVVGASGAHPPLWTDSTFDDTAVKPNGIVDERAVFIKERSVALARRQTFRRVGWPLDSGASLRLPVVDTCGLMGHGGIEQGPYKHMLDECALADPLLARLPAVYNEEWRPGHFRRMIPDGYRDSLEQSANLIKDADLAAFYDQLRLITRGPLLAAGRLHAIWQMNTGAFDHLIDRRFYRHAGAVIALDDLASLRDAGTAADAPGLHRLDPPLAVLVPDRRGRRHLDVTVDSDDEYALTFLRHDAFMGKLVIGPIPEYRRQPGLASHTIDLPPDAIAHGFDVIVIAAAAGDDPPALGHLLLDGHEPTDAELARRVAERDAARRR
jgi:arabinofuranosyltransferase